MSRARRCFRTCGRLGVAPEVFFNARLLSPQEGVGDGDQADVMMPSQPLAALVMVQSEFFFQFAIILFDPPTGFGDADETAQLQRLSVETIQTSASPKRSTTLRAKRRWTCSTAQGLGPTN